MKILPLFILPMLLLCSCSPSSDENDVITYPNVKAVYFQEENRYSIAYREGNEIKIIGLYGAYEYSTQILDDVPATNSMYVVGIKSPIFGGIQYSWKIHIHNIDDINTASWNHGKRGSGSTTRIDK
jgi:hypothetical protein